MLTNKTSLLNVTLHVTLKKNHSRLRCTLTPDGVPQGSIRGPIRFSPLCLGSCYNWTQAWWKRGILRERQMKGEESGWVHWLFSDQGWEKGWNSRGRPKEEDPDCPPLFVRVLGTPLGPARTQRGITHCTRDNDGQETWWTLPAGLERGL